MAFVDLGDQFIAFAERSEREPDRERRFGLVVDDRDAVLAAAREAGVEIFEGIVPRSLGEPRPGRRLRRDPVPRRRRRSLRGMGLELEDRVGAAGAARQGLA